MKNLKQKILLTFIFISVVTLLSCSNEHSSIMEGMHPTEIVELNNNELIKKIENKDSFVLIVSKDDCTFCSNLLDMLKKTNKQTNKDIYYINYNKTNRKIILSTIEENFGALESVPTIFILYNGQVEDKMVGYTEENKFWKFVNK